MRDLNPNLKVRLSINAKLNKNKREASWDHNFWLAALLLVPVSSLKREFVDVLMFFLRRQNCEKRYGRAPKNAPEVQGPKTGSSRTISEMALDNHLNYMNHNPAKGNQSKCIHYLFATVCLCEAIKSQKSVG